MADSLKKSWLHWEMQSLVSSNNRPLHFLQLAPSWLPYIFFAQNTFSLWVSEFSSKNSKDWECTTAFRVCAFGWPCTQLNLFMGIFLKLLCLKVLTALFSMRLKTPWELRFSACSSVCTIQPSNSNLEKIKKPELSHLLTQKYCLCISLNFCYFFQQSSWNMDSRLICTSLLFWGSYFGIIDPSNTHILKSYVLLIYKIWQKLLYECILVICTCYPGSARDDFWRKNYEKMRGIINEVHSPVEISTFKEA